MSQRNSLEVPGQQHGHAIAAQHQSGSSSPLFGTSPTQSSGHLHNHHHQPRHHTASPVHSILRCPRGSGPHPSSRAPSPTRATMIEGGGTSSAANSSSSSSPTPTPSNATFSGTSSPNDSKSFSPNRSPRTSDGPLPNISPSTSPAPHAEQSVSFVPSQIAGSSGVTSTAPSVSSPLAPHPSSNASTASSPSAVKTSHRPSSSSGGSGGAISFEARGRSAATTGIKLPPRAQSASLGGLSEKGGAWERKVGFDCTEENITGEFSFTLQVKSRGYKRTKNTRTFMCAIDENAYSERALEWLMESLVEDGDEIVALRVLEGEPWDIDQDEAREEARDLIDSIVDLNDDVEERKISIVVEFVAGMSVTSTVVRMIHVYRPDSLTIGTRGKTMNTLQKMLAGATMGSASRELLSRSPVPVVVVRPEAKVTKHRKKREADPKRRSYHDLVAKAKAESLPLSRDGSRDHHILGHRHFSKGDSGESGAKPK
ncbi:SUGAR UTILIZATION REGULATORY PROTEIN IMP2 [Ceraceosorus bombacis]|uniref:SUGAR UTILIZATION REGULATORY PROTEIN IMP2 n=1 Tax=Ceraceosorus bombacis TaxID=401625 RepID=A0A0P1BPU5_9BASI|nr:SUGAR UTILIZATION REGULATORY PROTEIN IMP2 [Ceraceosorus bombacis]